MIQIAHQQTGTSTKNLEQHSVKESDIAYYKYMIVHVTSIKTLNHSLIKVKRKFINKIVDISVYL